MYLYLLFGSVPKEAALRIVGQLKLGWRICLDLADLPFSFHLATLRPQRLTRQDYENGLTAGGSSWRPPSRINIKKADPIPYDGRKHRLPVGGT